MPAQQPYSKKGWLIMGLALATGLLAFLVPAPAGQEAKVFYSSFVTSVINGTLYTSSIVLFLAGLKRFKRGPRIAYGMLSVGLACAAIGALQYPFISLFNLWTNPYFANGWSETPFLVGLFLLYLSALTFSRLVGVKNLLTKWPVVITTILALSLLSLLIHHSADPTVEHSTDLLVAYNAWEIAFVAAGLGLLLATKKRTSVVYARPLAWLSIFYGLTILGGLELMVVFFVWGGNSWFITYNFASLTYILGAIATVKAAEAFSRNVSIEELPLGNLDKSSVTFWGKAASLPKKEQLSCIDAVTYLATLASDRQAIDPLLDKLRAVTAGIEPGQPISEKNQTKLAAICREVLDFLVSKEPVRNFSPSDLYALLADNFQNRSRDPIFWQALEKNHQ
jgi:hypothetical protein